MKITRDGLKKALKRTTALILVHSCLMGIMWVSPVYAVSEEDVKFTTTGDLSSCVTDENKVQALSELDGVFGTFRSQVQAFSEQYITTFAVQDGDKWVPDYHYNRRNKTNERKSSGSMSGFWSVIYQMWHGVNMNGDHLTDGQLKYHITELGLSSKDENGNEKYGIAAGMENMPGGYTVYDGENGYTISTDKGKFSIQKGVASNVTMQSMKQAMLDTEFLSLKLQLLTYMAYGMKKPSDGADKDKLNAEAAKLTTLDRVANDEQKTQYTNIIRWLDLWNTNPGLSYNIYADSKQLGANCEDTSAELYGPGDLYSAILGEYTVPNSPEMLSFNWNNRWNQSYNGNNNVMKNRFTQSGYPAAKRITDNSYNVSSSVNADWSGTTLVRYKSNVPMQCAGTASFYTPKSKGAPITHSLVLANLSRDIGGFYTYTKGNNGDREKLSVAYCSNDEAMFRSMYAGLSKSTDGIDIMDNYFNTLLSIVDESTFIKVIKNRYGVDLSTNPDYSSAEVADALKKWKESEQTLYKYALAKLDEVDALYQRFGITKYTPEIKQQVTAGIEKINQALQAAGLETVNNSEEAPVAENILANVDDDGPIAQFITHDENGQLTTTEDYNKLIAWTSTFTPFETNLYNIGENTAILDERSKALYKKYAKYRQPLSMIEDKANVYADLIQGSVKTMNYVTLQEFIDRVDTGDCFLYVNTLSQEDIKSQQTANVVVTDKAQGEVNESNDNQEGEEVTVNVSTPSLDSSQLTSNVRYFGPVYASSLNPEYTKVYSNYLSWIENSGTALLSNQVFSSDIADKLGNRTYNNYNQDVAKIRGDDGAEQKVAQAMSGEVVSSYVTQMIQPPAMYMNHMLMHNTLQDNGHKQSDLEEDLSNLLYMDFLGNIVTQSGYVVVPAYANATRTAKFNKYPIFTAQFINSYPVLQHNSSNETHLLDKDAGKKIIFIDWGLIGDRDKDYEYWQKIETGNSAQYTWGIGTPVEDGKKYINTLNINAPRMVSYLESDSVGADMKGGDSYDESVYGFPENAYVVNIFNPHNFVESKSKFIIITTDSKFAFDWHSNYPCFYISVNDNVGMAYLDSIPASLSSYEAAALYHLNYNAIKNNQEHDKYTYLNMDLIVGILTAVTAGSTDTTVVDSSQVDVRNRFKEDSVTNLIGTIFEGIYNPFIASIGYNEMVFIPTIDKFTVFQYLSIYVMPLILLVLLIIASVLIIMLATFKTSETTLSIKDLLMSLVATLMMGIFLVTGLEPTLKLLFQLPTNYLLQDTNLLMTAYELEQGFKDKSNNYFVGDKEEVYTGSPNFILQELSTQEARDWRKTENRPETDYVFYHPAFDSTKKYLSGNIYLQNKTMKMDVLDLLNTNSVTSNFGTGNTLLYEQTSTSSSDVLTYYLPYYNFTESLVYTLNAFAGSTSNTYRLINYNSGATKVTGRCAIYFRSIFFISPEDILPLLEQIQNDYANNVYTLEELFSTGELNTKETQDIVLDDGTVYTLNYRTLQSYFYLSEEMGGDLEDWLGIRRMLYMAGDNAPFEDKYMESVKKCRWFPKLDNVSEEELNEKIIKVNRNVKHFVLKEIEPMAETISDETIIKLIALKATMEYNKEFGSLCDTDLYPKQLDGSWGNNDFLTKSAYISRGETYNSESSSIGYYLIYNTNPVLLLLVAIERGAFVLRFILRNVAMFMALVAFFAVFICFLLKQEQLQKLFGKLFLLSVLMAASIYMEVIFFLIETVVANHTNIYLSIGCNFVLSMIATFIIVVVGKMIIDVVRDIVLKAGTPLSMFKKNPDGEVPSTELMDNQVRDLAEIGGDEVSPSLLTNYGGEDIETNVWEDGNYSNTDILPIEQRQIPELQDRGYSIYEGNDGELYASQGASETIQVAGNVTAVKMLVDKATTEEDNHISFEEAEEIRNQRRESATFNPEVSEEVTDTSVELSANDSGQELTQTPEFYNDIEETDISNNDSQILMSLSESEDNAFERIKVDVGEEEVKSEQNFNIEYNERPKENRKHTVYTSPMNIDEL